jgi:NitT/TauT family transport system ATP-binding protein
MKGTKRIPIDEAPVNPPSHAGVRVSIRDLGHSFGELDVLIGLNIDLAPHSVLGLVGPSGCGKSTFLEILCGLRQPSTGAVVVDGEMDAALRRSKCAFMPQRDVLLPWYSALDNAALALRNGGIRAAAARREAAELFSHFGLSGFERARPGHLSGGMRQRVAFLRTLLSGKSVLALDEPFAALDAITRAEMQEWLAGALSTHPRTTVLVSHDLEEALYLCDLVIVLSARPGRIVASMCSPSPRASDRNAAVTEPAFVASREEAMRALRKGAS